MRYDYTTNSSSSRLPPPVAANHQTEATVITTAFQLSTYPRVTENHDLRNNNFLTSERYERNMRENVIYER